MAISLTTITGPIFMPDGTMTPFGGKLCFELSSYATEEGQGTILHGPVYTDIDENGNFSVDLFTTSNADQPVTYKLYALWVEDTFAKSYVSQAYQPYEKGNYKKKYIGSFALFGSGPFRLDELSIVSEVALSTFDVWQEISAMATSISNSAVTIQNSVDGVNVLASQISLLENQTVTGVELNELKALSDAESVIGRSIVTAATQAEINQILNIPEEINLNSISITGGSVNNVSMNGPSITNATIDSLSAPLAISDGGTGANSASGARTALGIDDIETTANAANSLSLFNNNSIDDIEVILNAQTAYGRFITSSADAEAAHIALGLGTAALVNTGTAEDNVPLLDVGGKLSSEVVPSVYGLDIQSDNGNEILPVVTVGAGSIPSQQGEGTVLTGNILTTTSTIDVRAARYEIKSYSGVLRFSCAHNPSDVGIVSTLSIYKNDVLVQSYAYNASTAPVTRTNDVAISPGDVIEWRHRTNAATSIAAPNAPTADNPYVAQTAFIRNSEKVY